ncbi:hypothetical protein K8R30_02425 [archaeon]|nr:hypothetical protein [archaeon]
MILYFDNLITNIPAHPGVYLDIDKIRDSCKAYSTKDRYNVTLYTLLSYAELDWDEVVIVYEFGGDMVERKKEFEKFVRDLWPKAHIFYGRSDNQKKFQKRLKFVNDLEGDLVFYAGNNDHPFIAPDKETINSCIRKIKKMNEKWDYVSILYSHFLEGYRMGNKKSPYRKYVSSCPKILEESKNYFTVLFPEVWGHSIQIFNKKLINHIVFSEKFGGEIFRRIESIWRHERMLNKRVDQLTIIPKNPVCGHFDGYSHLKHGEYPISEEIFPPFFIPRGFFENKIKIRYGYENYKEGWVNINPMKAKHAFHDKNGTDMKISLEDIPLFWKKRISKIDINPKLNKSHLRKSIGDLHRKMRFPHEPIEDKDFLYRFKARIIAANYLPYWLKRLLRNNHLIKKLRAKIFFKLRDEFTLEEKKIND